MPFEVGKTLLQVEYRPRKRFAPVEEDGEEKGQRDWGAQDDEVSSGMGMIRSQKVLADGYGLVE